MKIKAKFKGANGSLGYKNGSNYKLRFTVSDGQITITPYNDLDTCSICRYDSLRSFLNNWQVF